jgi:sulfur carrier protein
MNFTLIFNEKKEIRSLDNVVSIKDVLDEMDLSSETIVAKKNGDIVIEDEKIENGDEIHLIQIIYGG